MKKIELVLAGLMLHSSLACIAIHLIAYAKSKEKWVRARAGIIREFDIRRVRLY
jgi:hypothetical protein